MFNDAIQKHAHAQKPKFNIFKGAYNISSIKTTSLLTLFKSKREKKKGEEQNKRLAFCVLFQIFKLVLTIACNYLFISINRRNYE